MISLKNFIMKNVKNIWKIVKKEEIPYILTTQQQQLPSLVLSLPYPFPYPWDFEANLQYIIQLVKNISI